jgi:hypothetical protein
MRRAILLTLSAFLAASAAQLVNAQRHGGTGFGSVRSGHGSNGGRTARAYGYAFLPYDYGYSNAPYYSDAALANPSQPSLVTPQLQPAAVEPPAPEVHPVIKDYKWPAASTAPSSSSASSEAFTLLLKNGSALSAEMVFASDDGLHYVDPEGRHLRIAMGEIDRAATLKLNHDRNLNLHLPAAQ